MFVYDNGRFLLPLGIVMDKKIQEINYYTNNIKLITMVNFSLEGKVALVTGASYGIGLLLHRLLLQQVPLLFSTISSRNW